MEVQEFTLHEPDLAHDYFYVQKKSPEYQTWNAQFMLDMDGKAVPVYIEDRNEWYTGQLDSWYIEDGSGNAPAANRHYFFKFEIDGKKYKLDLYDGLKVKVLAPTDEECKKVDWCQAGDWYPVGPWNPDRYERCRDRGTRYVTKHGQAVWYCNKHIPEWLKQEVLA